MKDGWSLWMAVDWRSAVICWNLDPAMLQRQCSKLNCLREPGLRIKCWLTEEFTPKALRHPFGRA